MKFGFDFHGVIQSYPEVFMPMMQMIRAMGGQVTIISGPPAVEVCNELKGVGYEEGNHYDDIVSVVDWLLKNNCPMDLKPSGWWTRDIDDWWRAKGKICEELKTDIMIDDSRKYAPYFVDVDTQFVLFEDCNFTDMLKAVMGVFQEECSHCGKIKQ